MEKQTNIPQLRFPEFTGEWEKKKLGEVAEINPSNKTLPQTFIYIDLESVANGELLKENEIIKDEAPSRAQRILKENDVLFQMVRPYQMNNLFFNKKGNYVASTGYAQIRTLQNSIYVFQYLHFQKFVDKVIERCTGTSYPAINSTDLSNIEISLPTLPEQTKIANFLIAVDEKIQALKKKQSLLEQYKKGVMQKLFSQELRFTDENGNEFSEWEKKKLGEVAKKITTGKLDANAMVEDGEYRFYTCAKDFYRIDKYAFDTEALLVSGNGANVGYIHYYKGKFNAYQRTYILDGFKDNIIYIKYYLDKFLYERINTEKKEGNTPYIVLATLSEMEIQIPCIKEQTKIANFLSSIDEKINQTNAQITQMETWKKGLLQKMFI
jgi:type I restriction enzyme S subunit